MLERLRNIKWLKALKITGWSILSLLVAVNLYIIFSGKFHLYKAIANTIFEGRLMPTIHERDIFYNRTIDADNPKEWETHHYFARNSLRSVDMDRFNSIETESFLIIKNDSLYFEKYWFEYHNHTKDSISNSFSVAKSIVSILVGIAIEDGDIQSLDQPVSDFLKGYSSDGKEKLTIRHLLTMSSGLNWDESASPFSDNTEAYYGWDLEGLMEKQDVVTEPGVTFDYMSGNTQIAAFILEEATGQTLSEYASEKLWTPIGATTDAVWNLDDKGGHEKAFCCVYATARDFARVGQLYLQNGRWGNRQVVPADYVRESLVPAKLKTVDGDPNKVYGLAWWLDQDYRGLNIFYARGILGQYIIVIPEYNLVVVRTGYERGEKLKTDHPEDLYWYIDAALAMIGELDD